MLYLFRKALSHNTLRIVSFSVKNKLYLVSQSQYKVKWTSVSCHSYYIYFWLHLLREKCKSEYLDQLLKKKQRQTIAFYFIKNIKFLDLIVVLHRNSPRQEKEVHKVEASLRGTKEKVHFKKSQQ